ncbi:HlyD family efflux transporter periplasmic adaptor subunit [Martelella sp. HB161492]|uniref:efflux RND transporter periplasmic adaptor subunit n=1 Tax=Martelella sp. HB161492 TaxID=2720726 RepID=UPI0015905A2C|nr:HlyD family efflux transporter periplasmic adaptor subunit [Martelella sp. HB161492]
MRYRIPKAGAPLASHYGRWRDDPGWRLKWRRAPILRRAGLAGSVAIGLFPVAGLAQTASDLPEIAASRSDDGLAPVKVELRPFEERITRDCEIGYGTLVAVVAPMDGRLTIMPPGDSVETGTLIARYDTTAFEHQRDALERDIAYLNAERDYKSGVYRNNMSAIRHLDIDARQQARDQMAAQVAEMKRLFNDGRLALSRFQEAQRKLDTASAELKRAQWQDELADRETVLEVQRLANAVLAKQSALSEVQARIAQASIRAPVAGHLVDVETVDAGRRSLNVHAGERIALLADPARLGTRLSFRPEEMRSVRGAEIVVTADRDHLPRPAKIAAIRSVETGTDSLDGRFETQVSIVFPADDAAGLLNSAATCSFSRPLPQKEPGVPVSAVFIQNDHSYVRKLDKGDPTLTEVELGEISDNYVRVLSGLRPGDLVLK